MTARDAIEPRRTMLITGATGFIGAQLAMHAQARGYCVRTLTRSDWTGRPGVPVEQRFLGALPRLVPGAAFDGVDVVVHCAAQPHGHPRAVEAVNVEGTRYLLELARRSTVETFIFLSSQSARPDAVSPYGRTKYAAEGLLLQERDVRTIILRPGLVTGPGSRGLFQRLARTVRSLPVIPLLGGGHTLVQPIHVDDLTAAILRCDGRSKELDKRILHLGDPDGLTLRELLQELSIAQLGRRKWTITIPIAPVEASIRAAEALRLPLPITSANLKGMKTVERMDTAPDLARLGLRLRPWNGQSDVVPASDDAPGSEKERATKVVLVGAGRIGLVHATTLQRLQGAVLAGIVDPSTKATGLLRGMGVSAPVFRSLDQALARVVPDAVVIATPPATHLRLTRAALPHVRAVMIEKPLAVRADELEEYRRLAQEYPERLLQVGYVMPRNPQVETLLEALRAGRLGKVRGFLGITLLSLISDSDRERWEVDKTVSGGGALINAGGHVLSMIHAAFGPPTSVEAETIKLHSNGVEDSVASRFRYPDFEGAHYCSWAIRGYQRQENRLVVTTDEGILIVTAGFGAFIDRDGDVALSHQLDFEVGFNLAPDYAGAGFTRELSELAKAAREGQRAPMGLEEAIRVEQTLFEAYRNAREVRSFTPAPALQAPATRPRLSIHVDADVSRPCRVLDLRDLPREAIGEALERTQASTRWSEFLITPAQLVALGDGVGTGERLRVTVPDFLQQSRLLSAGDYRQVVKEMGLGGTARATMTAAPLIAVERGATFWVAAAGLLGAALHAVPADFRGTLLIHGYLADFAFALRRLDMLDRLLAICRRTRPRARIGFHTNMAGEAVNALYSLETFVDDVSVLTSPRAVDMAAKLEAMRRARPLDSLRITAEVGLAPAIVHQVAGDAPSQWTFGADALLLGLAADTGLSAERRAQVARDWSTAFPGTELPEWVL
jgi:predicted dehydrogenase/nucleoside-diphosphate-sugar epimerase